MRHSVRVSGARARCATGILTVMAVCVGLTPTAAAAADFGLTQFEAGAASTQAGAHSDVTTTLGFRSDRLVELFPGYGDTLPNENVDTVVLDLPPGLVANAAETPACPRARFTVGACPAETQVGNAEITTTWLATGLPALGGELTFNPIYNLVPADDNPASIGVMVGASKLPAYIDIGVDNAGDYRVAATSTNLSTVVPIKRMAITLWGVPADPVHDPFRYDTATLTYGHPSPAPRMPFMVNPTDCATTPVTALRAASERGNVVTGQAESPKPTGCDRLTFEPTIDVTPRSTTPDTPTGMTFDLNFPQNDDPDGLATPALRHAVVDLPEGMTINPGAADGLAACTDAQSAIGTEDAASCPEAAKIGAVEVDVPALRKPLDGALYVASQQSDDPMSGKMFRLFLVANGQGVHLKLEGQVRADPLTGRLRATFAGNPQVPVEKIRLTFKGGPRAVLVTPPTCGPKTVDARLESWGGPTANVQSTFSVDCVPGAGGFLPSFSAGTVDPLAGAASPFTLKVHKPDAHADLNGLRLELPEGLLATIKGNLGTRVGTATVSAGPGSNPYSLSGPVVLEGAYGDAPYSLRVTVPAIAGPFNLGNVVVRQKIYVDPKDAHVTVVSDPLPTIVKGVPVRLQNLDVLVDKPGFMRNPTSCAVKQVVATLASVDGQAAGLSSRFQVGGCDRLPLKPTLSMAMTDPKATTQGKTTPFVATVRQSPGESGLKKAVVTLPPTLALMTKNAKELCTPEQAAARACPEGSIVGSASAVTPLLTETLTGPVYFVEGRRTTATGRVVPTLPKLWVALRGPIAVDLWADSDVEDDRLVTTFGFVPDAPISEFTLRINGGEHGILAVSARDGKADVCTSTQRAHAVFDGQNGKQRRWRPRVKTTCDYDVVSAKLYSTKAKVRIGGIGRGKLTVSGTGIRKTSRTIRTSDAATMSPKLTGTGKRLYRERKAIRMRVTFDPAAKGAKTRNVRATVKRAKPKAKAGGQGLVCTTRRREVAALRQEVAAR
jgi:hypothetical protein